MRKRLAIKKGKLVLVPKKKKKKKPYRRYDVKDHEATEREIRARNRMFHDTKVHKYYDYIEGKWVNSQGLPNFSKVQPKKLAVWKGIQPKIQARIQAKLQPKVQPKPKITKCPNCNVELTEDNQCDLCGWEYKEEEKEKRSRTIPKHIQREVWRRDDGKCVECGTKELLKYDHIIPFSRGGSNTARNTQLLCENCNRKKSNKIGD